MARQRAQWRAGVHSQQDWPICLTSTSPRRRQRQLGGPRTQDHLGFCLWSVYRPGNGFSERGARKKTPVARNLAVALFWPASCALLFFSIEIARINRGAAQMVRPARTALSSDALQNSIVKNNNAPGAALARRAS